MTYKTKAPRIEAVYRHWPTLCEAAITNWAKAREAHQSLFDVGALTRESVGRARRIVLLRRPMKASDRRPVIGGGAS